MRVKADKEDLTIYEIECTPQEYLWLLHHKAEKETKAIKRGRPKKARRGRPKKNGGQR